MTFARTYRCLKNNKLYEKTIDIYTHEYVDSLPNSGCKILTVSKALQQQYSNIFNDISILKGRANYVCSEDEDFACDLAPCAVLPMLQKKCIDNDRCPFFIARRDAFSSKFVSLNYSTFLSLPYHLQNAQYLVCDEATELEDELVGFYSCTIEYAKVKRYLKSGPLIPTEDKTAIYCWLNDLHHNIKLHYDEIYEMIRKGKNKRKLMSDIIKMRKLRVIYEKLGHVIDHWFTTEYVTDLDVPGKVIVTPLGVNVLAQSFFEKSDYVILMSGSIIDHKTFAETFGIDKYKYIEIPSEFESKKSPIYCQTKFKLNYKNLNTNLPKVTNMAKQICDQHSNEKGIIHTHTFKITEALKSKCKGSRFLYREAGTTNEDILVTHFENNNTVLISPSLGFGTSLDDEHGRFQIIMKAPYLPLNDKRISVLRKRNQKWYEMKALVNLVQMCGRTTRSKTDHSTTYILDACVYDLLKRHWKDLPLWFKDRII
jgi:hypothetical protein